jgi:pimeloyl-ACP methyl ester carboxylesterase
MPTTTDLDHRHIDVNGTRLHVVVAGEGPAVVLLHGWPYTWTAWRRLIPPLAAAGFTVIAPDLRGTGDSAKPADGYDKRNVARDVHELVGALGFADIALVGMDIGAMVAYAYAADHGAGVRRLVLAESVLPGLGLEELMNPATGGFWHFGFHMQVDVAELLTAGKEAAYLGPMWTMGSATDALGDAEQAELLRAYSAPGGMRGGFQHYATLVADGAANRADAGAGLAMPVLVLNGERGLPQGPLLSGVRQVATDVRADVVPGSGHLIGLDNPEWVADRLARFFASPPS